MGIPGLSTYPTIDTPYGTMWGAQDSQVGANNSNNYGLWYL